MFPIRTRIRTALSLALLAVCTSPIRADEAADLYARTLRGTALILTPNGSGTGWVIDLEQGLLVTNEHVVGKHEQVLVVFPVNGKDGKPVAEFAHYARGKPGVGADVVDVDTRRDLAIV